MIVIVRASYILLLSYNPCDIFSYYNVSGMHGLTQAECETHSNSTDSAYIAGWSNYVPKESGEYQDRDKRYIFINLSRCTDDIHTTGLVMHEMMHHSMWLHEYNLEKEEEIITWAETEAYEVVSLINNAKANAN